MPENNEKNKKKSLGRKILGMLGWDMQAARASKAKKTKAIRDKQAATNALDNDYATQTALKTQKNIASQSLAGSNNNNTFKDASIKLKETKLPSAKSPNVTETAAEAQTKLEGPKPEPVPEEKATETVAAETGSSPEVVQQATEQDPQARYKVSSIWDAYRSGAIDENTRDYMMLDAIRTSTNNFAQDQGKIAAAYGGGKFDANYQDSAWDARNKELLKQGISSEAATVEGSDKEMERQLQRIQAKAGTLNNEQKGYMLGASRTLANLSSKATTNTEKALLSALASDVADGNIDGKGLIAIAGASGFSDIKEFLFGNKEKK